MNPVLSFLLRNVFRTAVVWSALTLVAVIWMKGLTS